MPFMLKISVMKHNRNFYTLGCSTKKIILLPLFLVTQTLYMSFMLEHYQVTKTYSEKVYNL